MNLKRNPKQKKVNLMGMVIPKFANNIIILFNFHFICFFLIFKTHLSWMFQMMNLVLFIIDFPKWRVVAS
jgi:hypothetical protein